MVHYPILFPISCFVNGVAVGVIVMRILGEIF